MASRIARTNSGVDRSRSVSSIRRMNFPPLRRACSQLNSAVRAPPMWSSPVGLGANRVTTEHIFASLTVTGGIRPSVLEDGNPRISDDLFVVPAGVAGSRIFYQTGFASAKGQDRKQHDRGGNYPAHRDSFRMHGPVEALGVQGKDPRNRLLVLFPRVRLIMGHVRACDQKGWETLFPENGCDLLSQYLAIGEREMAKSHGHEPE